MMRVGTVQSVCVCVFVCEGGSGCDLCVCVCVGACVACACAWHSSMQVRGCTAAASRRQEAVKVAPARGSCSCRQLVGGCWVGRQAGWGWTVGRRRQHLIDLEHKDQVPRIDVWPLYVRLVLELEL